jgi:hypothetical protein
MSYKVYFCEKVMTFKKFLKELNGGRVEGELVSVIIKLNLLRRKKI